MRLANEYVSYQDYKRDPNGLFELFQTYLIDSFADCPAHDTSNEDITEDEFCYQLSEKERNFFEHFFVPGKKTRLVSNTPYSFMFNADGEKEIKLNQDVLDLLDFGLGLAYDNEPPLLLLASIGWGKTVLLRFTWTYLLMQSDYLRRKVLPIYISLDDHKVMLNELESQTKIIEYFEQTILLQRLMRFLEDFTRVESEEFWSFLKRLPDFAILRQREIDLNGIYSERETIRKEKIRSARSDVRSTPEYLVASLRYISETTDKVPLLILDNVDPLSLKVNEAILSRAYRLQRDYGVKVIISMREGTYNELMRDRAGDIRAHSPLIVRLKNRRVADYIEARTARAMYLIREKGAERYPAPEGTSYLRFKDAASVLKTMMDMLLEEQSCRVFDYLSYHNLRKINAMLITYLQTGYIDEHRLASKIISGEIDPNHDYYRGSPLWVLIAAIITKNYETFFSQVGHTCDSGNIISVYDNGEQALNRHIIRLHVLNYLNNTHGRGSRQQRFGFVNIKKLRKEYAKINKNVSNKKLKTALDYAVFRLLECRLITSPEYHEKLKLADVRTMNLIRLTDTGKYFLDEFRLYYEYIVYMKDDAEIGDNLKGIKDCIQKRKVTDRFPNVYLFVELLYEEESAFLQQINKLGNRKLFIQRFANSGKPFVSSDIARRMLTFGKENILQKIKLTPNERELVENTCEDFSLLISRMSNETEAFKEGL